MAKEIVKELSIIFAIHIGISQLRSNRLKIKVNAISWQLLAPQIDLSLLRNNISILPIQPDLPIHSHDNQLINNYRSNYLTIHEVTTSSRARPTNGIARKPLSAKKVVRFE